MPSAVPAIAGRSCRQPVEALDKNHGWSVARHHQQRGLKCAAGVMPASCTIGSEPFRKAIAKFNLNRCQLTFPAHDLKHGLSLALTERHDPIDFACLDARLIGFAMADAS